MGTESSLVLPVSLGVMSGLLLGKPVGILLFSWLAVRLKVAVLPAETSWRLIGGVACLAGIGFTMSLFVAALAFNAPELQRSAKLGIIAASTMAGLVGAFTLRRAIPRTGA